eukprot:403362834
MDDSHKWEESRKQILLQLSHQIQNFGDIKFIKDKQKKIDHQVEEFNMWQQKVSAQLSNEVVFQKELNTLVDIIKKEQITLIKMNFETHQKSVQKALATKVEAEEMKDQLKTKMDINEFKNEMQKIKNTIQLVAESGGGGGSKSQMNAGLKVLIRQETEKKVDLEQLEELLKQKAQQDFVQDMLERLNNLESHVYRPKSNSSNYFDDEEGNGDQNNQKQDFNDFLKSPKQGGGPFLGVHDSTNRFKGSNVNLNSPSIKSKFSGLVNVQSQMNIQRQLEQIEENKKKLDKFKKIDKVTSEMANLKKKFEDLFQGYQKQTTYYDDKLKTVVGQLEGVEKLEKKLSTNMSQLDQVNNLKKQMDNVKENFERMMNEMKKTYQQKLEHQQQKSVSLNTKCETLEQKIQFLQELIKRNIPGFERERLELETSNQDQYSRFSQVEGAIGHVNETMVLLFNKLDSDVQQIKGPIWDSVQKIQRENESLNRELERQQDIYRKMMTEFSKTVIDKKEQRIVEFFAEQTKPATFNQSKAGFTLTKSKLPSIDFNKQAAIIKSLSNQNSPRSVSEISQLTKALHEVKRLELHEEKLQYTLKKVTDKKGFKGSSSLAQYKNSGTNRKNSDHILNQTSISNFNSKVNFDDQLLGNVQSQTNNNSSLPRPGKQNFQFQTINNSFYNQDRKIYQKQKQSKTPLEFFEGSMSISPDKNLSIQYKSELVSKVKLLDNQTLSTNKKSKPSQDLMNESGQVKGWEKQSSIGQNTNNFLAGLDNQAANELNLSQVKGKRLSQNSMTIDDQIDVSL